MVTIACVFKEDGQARETLSALLASGSLTDGVRIGARDRERASSVAAAIGAAADVDPEDPLAGLAGLASDRRASESADKGAVNGALAGAVAGLLLGLSHFGGIMNVPRPAWPVADAVFFLVLGSIGGAALGNALGPQRSTHAGFALIDAMEAGAICVLVGVDDEADPGAAERAMRALEVGGGEHVMRVPSSPKQKQA